MGDELDRYLAAAVEENVTDPLGWWYENRFLYPRLYRMGLDYLTIPGKPSVTQLCLYSDIYLTATSVDVERLFSRGCIVLNHLRNRLSPQSTRALLCLQNWSLAGLVKDSDVLRVTRSEPEVLGDDDIELEEGWDSIIALE
jgi:hypothetical protein